MGGCLRVRRVASMCDYHAAIEAQEEAALGGNQDISAVRVHMAACLCALEIDRARFLWKRSAHAQGDEQLKAMWAVGQAIWKKDWAGAHQALDAATAVATGEAAALVGALRGVLQETMFSLIARAYESITISEAARLLGMAEA